ncbi:MAG: SufE family protein [Bacteroidales bacterium]|jgi:cysteine desulfuration protein SufE|nr:SufE family protein [Bacteroidales bacterium]MBQ1883437.1 SufE family protein [Bacteroidales bacterium]MBQ3617646.1 SufE family protein [Bacteroidales bacterium]
MTINQIQDEIIEEFSVYEEWLDKYEYLIELGNSLEVIDESQKTPDNIIQGCQSRVWLDCKMNDDGTLTFTADSDAIITKGIIALLIRAVNNQKPQDIIDADLYFIEQIGLKENLSPTRANGLLAMIKQIRYYALAFNALQKDGKN